MSVKISDRLKRLRKLSGKKLREVSKDTGLSIGYIGDIEKGRTTPSLKTCEKLMLFYGCISLSVLFDGVEL